MIRERLGCFFIIIALAVLLLYAAPLAMAFFQNPQTVPLDWIGVALAAFLVLWFGWRLYRAGAAHAAPQAPASLAERMWQRYRNGGPDDD